MWFVVRVLVVFFCVSGGRRHTRCVLVTGVQTCALPIYVASAIVVAHGIETDGFAYRIQPPYAAIWFLRCRDLGEAAAQGIKETALRQQPLPRAQRLQIGRASCRERVCRYVELLVVAVSFKKQQKHRKHKQYSSYK